MSESLRISRRDFLNGIALGVVARSAMTALEAQKLICYGGSQSIDAAHRAVSEQLVTGSPYG